MNFIEHLKSDPQVMRRAVRCASAEELHMLTRIEGIEADFEEVKDTFELFELGEAVLQSVAGGQYNQRWFKQPRQVPISTQSTQVSRRVVPISYRRQRGGSCYYS